MHADVEAVRELIEPLGLAPKRAPMLIRFSKEYVEKQVCGHGPGISYTITAPQVTGTPSLYFAPCLPCLTWHT